MNKKKWYIPRALKIILVIVAILLSKLVVSLFIYDVYHFPSDSLSNYPGTQWKCDKLGLEFFIDSTGNISGYYQNGSEKIPLDVTARSSTTYHSNYIQCVAHNGTIYLHCFYRNVNKGKFYVIIDADESTLDLDAITEIMPYKFVKQ